MNRLFVFLAGLLSGFIILVAGYGLWHHWTDSAYIVGVLAGTLIITIGWGCE